MPGFTVTRGLGPGATPTNLIARGFVSGVTAEAVRILRAGRSAASRARKDLIETFKISAMLELLNPISKNIRKTFAQNEIVIKKISAKSVKQRKTEDIKVIVENVKVRNKKNV